MFFALYFFLNNNPKIRVVSNSTIIDTPIESKGIKILFVGDIMLDRGVSFYAEQKGKEVLFKNMKELFNKQDAIIANLEGTLTNNISVAKKNNKVLRFTFDPSFAPLLKSLGFSALSLANNHTSDFGIDGYNQTVYNLNLNNIKYFGSASNDINLSTKLIIKDKTFCLVGYHDLYTYKEAPVIKEIEKIKNECNHITVLAHWGVEYSVIPNERQISLAHKFIDIGADLIIGAHPHVVQTNEIYKNKAIFYSLGNFMFDQSFSYNTEHGLMVELEIDKDKTVFNLIPTYVKEAEVSIDETKTIETFIIENNPINELLLKPEYQNIQNP